MRNKIVKKWDKFIKESIIEFPLKKTMSIVKDVIKDKIKEGKNIFKIDDSSFVEFILVIEYTKKKKEYYKGNVDAYDVVKKIEGEDIDIIINVIIDDMEIDYNELLSCILHELKHVFDVFDEDYDIQSFLQIKPVVKLKSIFKGTKYYEFMHLVYESLQHEIDARNHMIYDRLRWLKTYDNIQLEEEFKKTYVYKSLMNMKNFNAKKFIESYNKEELIKYTKTFIEHFDNTMILNDLYNFYYKWEQIFHKLSVEYLEKAKKVIEELVVDKKPYMEKYNMIDVYSEDGSTYFPLVESMLLEKLRSCLFEKEYL